jgi:hypothetical protein
MSERDLDGSRGQAEEEAHIRALVVQALTQGDFVMRSLRSEDLDGSSGLVEVTAELHRTGRVSQRTDIGGHRVTS